LVISSHRLHYGLCTGINPIVLNAVEYNINFQLSFTLYAIVCTVTIVGILLLPVLFIFWLVFVIRAMVLDKHQTEYKYPFTIRFIKQH